MRARTLAPTQRAEAERTWRELERGLEETSLACSWEWTGTWLEHYGEVVPHRFVLAERKDTPCAIALITEPVALGRLRVPAIALGTAGEPPGSSVFVERNRLLCDPHDMREFARCLMGELEHDRSWQRLRFDGMTIADAEQLLGGRGDVRSRVEESPFADLRAGDGADVLDSLPKKGRHRARQALERLAPLQTQWAATTHEAQEMFDELISLHTARWRLDGHAGAFADRRFTAFHRNLITKLHPHGRAALFRVQRHGETLGCLYGLIDGERMLFYQGGLRRFADNRMRVGLAAHTLFMQACRERGLGKYDFLAPAARYKRELSTGSEKLVWAELERPGWRLRVERAARTLARAIGRR